MLNDLFHIGIGAPIIALLLANREFCRFGNFVRCAHTSSIYPLSYPVKQILRKSFSRQRVGYRKCSPPFRGVDIVPVRNAPPAVSIVAGEAEVAAGEGEDGGFDGRGFKWE